MFKSSFSQDVLAPLVPTSLRTHMTSANEGFTSIGAECTYTTCPQVYPYSSSSSSKEAISSTSTSLSRFLRKASSKVNKCSRTTTTTSTAKNIKKSSLSGSMKWLMMATVVMLAAPSMLMSDTLVEAVPMPEGPSHPSHCPDEGQCNFACMLRFNSGGTCIGPERNVCLCDK